MSTLRPVTEDFAVADQIRPEDVGPLAGRFRLLINNRPDGEEAEQPPHRALQTAAEAAGLDYRFIPISGAPTREQVELTRQALDGAAGPCLAFCRTGTRSIITWAAAEALAGRPVDALITEGARAGYDLGPPLGVLLPRLRA